MVVDFSCLACLAICAILPRSLTCAERLYDEVLLLTAENSIVRNSFQNYRFSGIMFLYETGVNISSLLIFTAGLMF